MSLFRPGNWSFGQRGHSLRDASPRSLEDDSFDTGSNLPVYLSKHEAGEWMVPLDENGEPVEIIDDEDDDKYSDVASSVVSTSTAAESRQFWLNCLKENGVDMNASAFGTSPRRPLSTSHVSSASPLSSARSPKLLTPHDHNVRHNFTEDNDDENSNDTSKRLTSSGSSEYRSEKSYDSSSEPVRLTKYMARPFDEPSFIETSKNTEPNEDEPAFIGVPQKEEPEKSQPLMTRIEDTDILHVNVPEVEQKPVEQQPYIQKDPAESVLIAPSSPQTKKVPGMPIHSHETKNRSFSFEDGIRANAVDTCRVQVTTVTSQESDDTTELVGVHYDRSFTSEDDQDYLPNKMKIHVTTVASGESNDISLNLSQTPTNTASPLSVTSSNSGQSYSLTKERIVVTTVFSQESDDMTVNSVDVSEKQHESIRPQHEGHIDDLLSNSVDDCIFVDESVDTEETKRPWTQKPSPSTEENNVQKETEEHNTASSKSRPETDGLLQSQTASVQKDDIPWKTSWQNEPKQEPESVPSTEQVQNDSAESWMYLVWYRKGLMKTLPSCSKGAMSIRTPRGTSSDGEPRTLKTKNGIGAIRTEGESSTEPLVTPKDAFVTLDYKAVRASEEDVAKRGRRSLPVNMRGSAQKEAGRKSFENIMQMWRNKSEDRPNSFFSPEHYMMDTRERAQSGHKSKPTAHTQLLSIAERTAMLRKEPSSASDAQEEKKETPRSISVDSGKKLAGTLPAVGSGPRAPLYHTFSPAREFSIDEQLQRPPKRLSSGKRRKSQPIPPTSRSSEKEKDTSRRRETLNPKEHFRRHISPGASLSDYKSVIKNDYKSVVKSFLASVEEHKELEDPEAEQKREIVSNMSGIDPIPHEISTDPSDLGQPAHDTDTITPRSMESDGPVCPPAKQSATKDSPWTEQMVRQLDEVPLGSAGKKSPWGEERPWRQDLVKRRVSSFSECSVASMEEGPCQCSVSAFSGNDELIDFFLPQMGMACNCGRRPLGLLNPEEPTALENILRPWQVRFLAAFGIHRGDQLVKAHHRSAKALANALRQYRRKHGMTPFRTKSCGMALQIWSKTSKAYVRSIRKQLTSGTTNLKVPNTLYIISSFLEKMHEMHSPLPRNPGVVQQDEASV